MIRPPHRIVALDSGAVIALANNDRTTMTVLKEILAERTLVIIPAPVLAEVLRGRSGDAAVHRILNKWAHDLVPTSADAATRAGKILGHAGAPPTLTIDALIDATALEHGAADLLTSDPDDHRQLAGTLLNILPC